MAKLVIQNQSEPTTPQAGLTQIYVDSVTKKLSTKDDVGLVTEYLNSTVMKGRLYAPFGAYGSLGTAITTTSTTPHMCTVDRNWTLIQWTQAWYVLTTNNGSNYWTVNIKDLNGTLVATFNTSAGSAATWTHGLVTSFSVGSVTTANKILYTEVIKTGSPGGINLPTPALEIQV